MSATLGDEGDISNLCNHGWYDWCYYREQNSSFPMQKEMLRKVLGPTRNVGNTMSQWILKANGKIVPRRTLHPLLPGELSEGNVVEKENNLHLVSRDNTATLRHCPLNQQSLNPTTFHIRVMRLTQFRYLQMKIMLIMRDEQLENSLYLIDYCMLN